MILLLVLWDETVLEGGVLNISAVFLLKKFIATN